MSTLVKMYPVADEFFHTDRPTDGQTDMIKLTIAFRNFAATPN